MIWPWNYKWIGSCFPLSNFSAPVVDCGDPGTPSHGSREPDPVITELSNVVRYSCDEGYELLGSQERTCQASGEWSGQLPMCQSELGSYSGSCNNNNTGSYMLVLCTYIGGILKVNLPTMVESRIFCCILYVYMYVCLFAVVDCGDPGSPNDGINRVFSTTFGSVAHYECDSSFRLVGTGRRICQPNGQWSGSLPSCMLIDCGPPESPQNGLVVLRNGTTLGARATYQCKVGFRLSSEEPRFCLTDEVWSGTVPTCTRECHQQTDWSLHYECTVVCAIVCVYVCTVCTCVTTYLYTYVCVHIHMYIRRTVAELGVDNTIRS